MNFSFVLSTVPCLDSILFFISIGAGIFILKNIYKIYLISTKDENVLNYEYIKLTEDTLLYLSLSILILALSLVFLIFI